MTDDEATEIVGCVTGADFARVSAPSEIRVRSADNEERRPSTPRTASCEVGISAAAVFSQDGRSTLGDGLFEVPAELAKRALSPVDPFTADAPDGRIVAVPLPNLPRCLAYHKP